jgi:hypothetical protein
VPELNNATSDRPAFLITIDTEGNNVRLDRPEAPTDNARFLPRFQELCDRYGFKPTYLTNYEMAMDSEYVEWARDQIMRGSAEVGMHLHAWNSPPLRALTKDDYRYAPYLIEYPDNIMREKITFMTDLLAEKFGRRPTSHRAGRWGFDERYAKLLLQHGYIVDCSVVPGVSFASSLGAPQGKGGPDFRQFPEHAYFIDPADIRLGSRYGLLELPVTTMSVRPYFKRLARLPGIAGRVGRRLQKLEWLRPNGNNIGAMLWCVDRSVSENRPYIEFMLHSSELMPGAYRTFATAQSIEVLYEHMEMLFERIAKNFAGETLTEYAEKINQSVAPMLPLEQKRSK